MVYNWPCKTNAMCNAQNLLQLHTIPSQNTGNGNLQLLENQ